MRKALLLGVFLSCGSFAYADGTNAVTTNVPPTITCPIPATFECTGSGGTLVSLDATVGDADGDALTVVWIVDGAPVQTNDVPAGAPPTSATVNLSAVLALGPHTVSITASDGISGDVNCTTTATVADTTPPVITSASVTPTVLWPPNHKMVNVQVSITATDLCSAVTYDIKSVTSNEPGKSKGKGKKSAEWNVTGPLSLQLRAERDGKGSGRTYTIIVEAKDSAGNSATQSLTVRVPHDQRDHSASGDDSSSSNGKGKGKGKGH